MEAEDLEINSLKTTKAQVTVGRLHINGDPSLKIIELNSLFGP